MAAAPGFNDPSTPRAYVTIKASTVIDRRSLSIRECDDDPSIRKRYRPYLLEKDGNTADWVDDLELGTVTTMAAEYMQRIGERMKVLVLFGSLRQRLANDLVVGRVSKVAMEGARLMSSAGHTRASQLSKLPVFSLGLAAMFECMILPACPSKTTYNTSMRRYKSCGV